MNISIRFNSDDMKLLKAYTKIHNISVSEFVRNAVFEKIEDEYDLRDYEDAMAEYRQNPKVYSLEEVVMELNKNDLQS